MPRYAVSWEDNDGVEHARVPWYADSPTEAATALVGNLVEDFKPGHGRYVTVHELVDTDPVRVVVRPAFSAEVLG